MQQIDERKQQSYENVHSYLMKNSRNVIVITIPLQKLIGILCALCCTRFMLKYEQMKKRKQRINKKKNYNNTNEVDISIERKIEKEMNKERNSIINQVTFDSKIY